MIRGGCSLSGGSSGSPGLYIPLNNVPYITQYTYNQFGTKENRSEKYCGIAAALMVRAKNEKDRASPPSGIYNISNSRNASSVDSDIRTIDNNLSQGKYGYSYSNRKIDVLTNDGLLYVDPSMPPNTMPYMQAQYYTTVEVLTGVYTGLLGNPKASKSDNILWDNGHVSGVSMRPIDAGLKSGTTKISEATVAIWNHIKDYRQPVIVVVDSNKQINGGVNMTTIVPTLHYMVITGISEERSGGTRHFEVNDPAEFVNNNYSEHDLRKLIAIPSNAPVWVYDYGTQTTGSPYPAYILMVQGD